MLYRLLNANNDSLSLRAILISAGKNSLMFKGERIRLYVIFHKLDMQRKYKRSTIEQ
jgi:hypothetical protein